MIKNTSSQEIKTRLLLKTIEILLPFGSHNKNLLKFSEYYVVENVLHIIHVLSNNFLPMRKCVGCLFWACGRDIFSHEGALKTKPKHMENGEKFKPISFITPINGSWLISTPRTVYFGCIEAIVKLKHKSKYDLEGGLSWSP